MVRYALQSHTPSISSGTKNVAKAMKPIACGPVKKAGLTWFPELLIKVSSYDHVFIVIMDA